MHKLTRKEEELMKIVWKLEKAFLKDIIEYYPSPKPHYNTVATIAKTLLEKGVIGYKQYGNTYQYFPIISKDDYKRSFMNMLVSNYFDDSYKNLVSFFVKEKGLTNDQLDELVRMIKDKR